MEFLPASLLLEAARHLAYCMPDRQVKDRAEGANSYAGWMLRAEEEKRKGEMEGCLASVWRGKFVF